MTIWKVTRYFNEVLDDLETVDAEALPDGETSLRVGFTELPIAVDGESVEIHLGKAREPHYVRFNFLGGVSEWVDGDEIAHRIPEFTILPGEGEHFLEVRSGLPEDYLGPYINIERHAEKPPLTLRSGKEAE